MARVARHADKAFVQGYAGSAEGWYGARGPGSESTRTTGAFSTRQEQNAENP